MVKKKSEAKKDSKKDVPKKDSKKMKFNVWMIVSLVLIVALVALIIVGVSTSVTKAKAGKLMMNYLDTAGADATLVSVKMVSGVYEVSFEVDGTVDTLYVSKDGKNFIGALYPVADILGQTTTSTDTTATSECYHSISCDLEASVELMDSIGIDSDTVLSCVDSKGDSLYAADYSAAQAVGVTGSPSLVINGIKVSTARTEEAYLSAVCSAFTDNAVPDACDCVTRDATSLGITQSAEPSIGLYIWSYCPYGVTAQVPFAQVAETLGTDANFKIYLYYAGHGDYELQQNKIQACIQDLGYETEYWEYSQGFVNNIYPLITSSSGATSSGSC